MPKQSRTSPRIGSRRGNSGLYWLGGLVVLGLVAFWALAEYTKPGRSIPGLESFADEGRQHVETGAPLSYKTDPPTSGPHYGWAILPGVYREPQPVGALVHSLEHGNIVIYYDPERTPQGVMERLERYASRFTGQWDGVVLVPRQQEEEVVLTAWRQMLRQPKFHEKQADQFIDAFRGRGPENPVR